MIVNNKKGITLVMLVILIVVMGILLSMMVVGGVGATEEAKHAKFLSKVANVEDAVKIQIADNMLVYKDKDVNYYQWIDVIEGYKETSAITSTLPVDTHIINGEIITYEVEEDILIKLKFQDDIGKFFVDLDGTVYYDNHKYNDTICYNAKTIYLSEEERYNAFIYKMQEIQNAYDVKVVTNGQNYSEITDPNNSSNTLEWDILNPNNYSQYYKWIDIVDEYNLIDARQDYKDDTSSLIPVTTINGVDVYKFEESFLNGLGYDKDIDKIFVSENGDIYHVGYTYNGITYYNVTTAADPMNPPPVP